VSKSHATLRYTSMRFSIFGAVFFVSLMLAKYKLFPVSADAMGVLLIACFAAVVSGLLSYVLLSKQRDEMSAQIADRIERRTSKPKSMKSRFAAQAAEEDALDDAQRASQDV
jgi:C4-dicarboxylate-specific signal transduction histidine kinase